MRTFVIATAAIFALAASPHTATAQFDAVIPLQRGDRSELSCPPNYEIRGLRITRSDYGDTH